MKTTMLVAALSAAILTACGPNPQPVVYTQPQQPVVVQQQPGYVNGQPVIVQQGGMSAGEGALLGAGAGFLAGRMTGGNGGGYNQGGYNSSTHTTTIIHQGVAAAPTAVAPMPAATSGRVIPQQATAGPSFRQAQNFTVTKSTSSTVSRVASPSRRR